MTVFKRFLTLFGLSLIITSCSVTNSKTFDSAYLSQNLITGKTTVEDVERLLGKPDNRRDTPNGVYFFQYSKNQSNEMANIANQFIPGLSTVSSIADAADGKSGYDSLTVYFRNNKVSGYNLEH